MLVIRVVSFKGKPVAGDLVAQFGEAGGTIGRGKNSTLVLPDPEQFISRTHAIISFQAGGYIVTDNGTKNPVILDGQPLGAGAQARLGDGSEMQIGDYRLNVSLSAAVAAAPPGFAARTPKDDPLALIPRSGSGPDPFADLEAPAHAGRAHPPEPPRPDRDPFAGLHRPEPSIDALLDAGKPARSPAKEPLPGAWPIGQHEAGPGVVDPLDVLLGIVKPVPRPTVADHGPEVATPYVPPVARPEPVPPPPAPPVAAPSPMAPPADVPLEGGFGSPPPPLAGDEGAVAAPALLRAFLQGAGLRESQLASLTPEAMETIGQLLRESVQGTLDLLRARGVVKSEIRADVTMIMPVENNPLKFSPTVETALGHLLQPGVAGFVSPVRAVKEAYDDLRAHHLGFLAGMRAALDDVLLRFTPAELEKRLAEPSVLDTVLPINRKAKLWDLFVERYGDVAGEARENFNAVFGKAFVRAYEAQVKELRAASSQRR